MPYGLYARLARITRAGANPGTFWTACSAFQRALLGGFPPLLERPAYDGGARLRERGADHLQPVAPT